MAILVGSARIDENGNGSGGKAGDQTGNEVCTQEWYVYSNGGWDYMAIPPTASGREGQASLCEQACANDDVGYDKNERNTLHTKAKAKDYDIAAITDPCECDCSSLQHVCGIGAGIIAESTYGSNGFTTSSMKSVLKSAGYKIIDDSTYLKSSSYCVRGAVYVAEGHHTVCGLTNGSNYKSTLEKAGLSDSSSSSSGTTTTTTSDGTYFTKYTGSSGSIVTALNSIGVESSYSYRKEIAVANNISNYTGTASQNTTMLNMLKSGTLKKPSSSTSSSNSSSSYYPKYTGNSSSIVDGLKAVGVDSGYSARKKIASANSISNYTGTASQNTTMLNLLKKGTLKKASGVSESSSSSSSSSSSYYSKYTGSSGSIVDALKAVGVDSSYSNRKKIAAANGISNYTGTASQNTQMLNLLKSGKLKKA